MYSDQDIAQAINGEPDDDPDADDETPYQVPARRQYEGPIDDEVPPRVPHIVQCPRCGTHYDDIYECPACTATHDLDDLPF